MNLVNRCFDTCSDERLVALSCMDTEVDRDSYISDAVSALGIEIHPVNEAELEDMVRLIQCQVLILDITLNPESKIQTVETICFKHKCVKHVKFFTDTELNVELRIRIASLKNAFLYGKDTSFIKVANDIKFHLSSIRNFETTVMLIDDSPTESYATKSSLEENGYQVEYYDCPSKAMSRLADNKPDLIICDLYMPRMNGDVFVRLLRQDSTYAGIPVVFLSSEADSRLKIDAVSNGADDFITKPIDPELFPKYIGNRIIRSREQRDVMDRDSLTGLFNHSCIIDKIKDTVRNGKFENVSILMLDIDFFKKVNDTHGHASGDIVLKSLSVMLSSTLRTGDLVGRYGGEEFMIALPDTKMDVAKIILDRILEKFKKIGFVDNNGNSFVCSFSAGLAEWKNGKSVDAVFEEADEALYAAKNAGRSLIKIAV